uniref:uncharacterized protein LOC114678229 n=1 Tax=Macaca mulatta TaxID=9544 RepID=UPI0010A20217|nr:uncharacterized protein LOC114678229 [Macaca mulatta]
MTGSRAGELCDAWPRCHHVRHDGFSCQRALQCLATMSPCQTRWVLVLESFVMPQCHHVRHDEFSCRRALRYLATMSPYQTQMNSRAEELCNAWPLCHHVRHNGFSCQKALRCLAMMSPCQTQQVLVPESFAMPCHDVTMSDTTGSRARELCDATMSPCETRQVLVLESFAIPGHDVTMSDTTGSRAGELCDACGHYVTMSGTTGSCAGELCDACGHNVTMWFAFSYPPVGKVLIPQIWELAHFTGSVDKKPSSVKYLKRFFSEPNVKTMTCDTALGGPENSCLRLLSYSLILYILGGQKLEAETSVSAWKVHIGSPQKGLKTSF